MSDEDETVDLEPMHFAILTEADVAMIEMAMTAGVDYLDYAPLYDDEGDE